MAIEYGESPDIWGRVAEVYAEQDAGRMSELDRILGKSKERRRGTRGPIPAAICPRGHDDWRVTPGGRRYCYTCHKIYQRAYMRSPEQRMKARLRYAQKKLEATP